MLEERLVQFEGTVLVVSHDRTFLNNVVTSTIVYEDGGVREYVGGYDDWLRLASGSINKCAGRRVPRRIVSHGCKSDGQRHGEVRDGQRTPKTAIVLQRASGARRGALETIEKIETEIAALHAEMAQPEYYRQPGSRIAEQAVHLKELESQLLRVYERWQELDQFAE